MNRVRDVIRALLLSPEVVCVLIPLSAYTYAPGLADVLIKPMRENLTFGLSTAALPLAMLAFNYKESLELLSPTGTGNVLLEWPAYPMLKVRVLIALGWCGGGLLAVVAGVWMVEVDLRPQLGVAIVIAGVLAAGAATVTIGLARFRLRELLGKR